MFRSMAWGFLFYGPKVLPVRAASREVVVRELRRASHGNRNSQNKLERRDNREEAMSKCEACQREMKIY